MKLWPDNTSHHLKYINDILIGYFYQSFMKSLSQHIWKKATRVRNNSAEYEDDQHTRAGGVTSMTLPVGLKTQGTRDSTHKRLRKYRSHDLLAQYFLPPVKQGTPRAAPSSSQAGRAQRTTQESGNTVQSADRRSRAARSAHSSGQDFSGQPRAAQKD